MRYEVTIRTFSNINTIYLQAFNRLDAINKAFKIANIERSAYIINDTHGRLIDITV